MSEFETRNVVLDQETIGIIDQVVEDKGLGGKGFSAGLRMIVREWSEINDLLKNHKFKLPQEIVE